MCNLQSLTGIERCSQFGPKDWPMYEEGCWSELINLITPFPKWCHSYLCSFLKLFRSCPIQQHHTTRSYWIFKIWIAWIEVHRTHEIHLVLWALNTKKVKYLNKCLYLLHVEMIIFWKYWVRWNISLKVISPVLFLHLFMWLLESFKLHMWFTLYFYRTVMI